MFVIFRILLPQPFRNSRHLGFGLSERHTLPQLSENIQIVVVSVLEIIVYESHRGPDLQVTPRVAEAARHHTYYRERSAVEQNTPPDHIGIARKSLLPEGIPEHHRCLRARLIIRRSKHS